MLSLYIFLYYDLCGHNFNFSIFIDHRGPFQRDDDASFVLLFSLVRPSVTRLGDFKDRGVKFPCKRCPQIFGYFLGYFEKQQFKVKTVVGGILGRFWKYLGFFFSISGHTVFSPADSRVALLMHVWL